MNDELAPYTHFIQDETGYCFWDDEPGKIPFIYSLFVKPEHRNKGSARNLLTYIINKIYSKYGNTKIYIEPNPTEKDIDKERLTNFYKSLGLTIIKIEKIEV